MSNPTPAAPPHPHAPGSTPGANPGSTPGSPAGRPPARPTEKLDIAEKGAPRDGQPQRSDRRLFMQLLVFTGCSDNRAVVDAIEKSKLPAVVYADMNDPRGMGLLTFSESPDHFVTAWRDLLLRPPFGALTPRPNLTMFGRSYALGFEPDLEETLFRRPIHTALNPAWPWAIWYPLRRAGQFERLTAEEQRAILMEHGMIGRQFVEQDFAHDIRLMSYGLDQNDNDFTIALIGEKLHPLSAIVQAMRKTQQTSLYLESLGPFFVGKAVWQSPESV